MGVRFIEIEDDNGVTHEVSIGPRGYTDTFGREPHVPRHLWDSDDIGGHAIYCTNPHHSTMHWCAASDDEPWTLNAGASNAWRRDHGLPERKT